MESGDYEISFYVLMLCNETGCSDAQDSIEISVDYGQDVLRAKYDYENIGIQKKWNKQTFPLTLNEGELKVKLHYDKCIAIDLV